MQYFREEWIKKAKNSSTGLNYLEMARFDCQLKSYLTLKRNKSEINISLKYRTGNHQLEVKTGNYKNRKPYEERTCKICNDEKVETFYHFIVECSVYGAIRNGHIPFLINVSKIESFEKLNHLKTSELKAIAAYISEAERIRSEKVESISRK